jgi:hypothetical protein
MDWYLFKKLNTLTYNFVELMATEKGRQLNCFHPLFWIWDLGTGMDQNPDPGKKKFRICNTCCRYDFPLSICA